MNFFDKFMQFITPTADTPPSYGVFHIAFFVAVVASTVLLCLWLKNADEKLFKRVLFVMWIIIVVGEIYRELTFTFDVSDGVASYDYAWYQFPFQMCSAPIYLLPPLIFMKDGRVRDAIAAYMMTFSLFGGLVVMVYPNDVLCSYIGINVQSLIHHGLQVTIGILLAIRMREKLDYKLFIKSLCTFGVMISIAMLLNLIGHETLTAFGQDDTFNMFYISPFHDCHLPILSTVQASVPYPIFFLCYLFGFSLIAAIMFFGQKLIIDFVAKKRESSN